MLRLTVLAAGLVLAAGAAAAFLLVLAVWGARAAWARLTGRSSPAFVRFHRHFHFGESFRPARQRAARARPAAPRHLAAEITDVEARPLRER